MADLGAIGRAIGEQADTVTPAESIGRSLNYGPAVVPLLSVAPGMWSIGGPAGGQQVSNISGLVLEDDIPVADALVILLFDRPYGSPKTSQASVVGTFYPDVPQVIRSTRSGSDGSFAFYGIKDDSEKYLVVAYNPNNDSINAKAVGARLLDVTSSLELDFAHQRVATNLMFFLLN